MCGQVYIKRKDGKPAFKSVLKRYRAQKERGISGFGYVAIQDNMIVSYQRAETEQEIVDLICKETATEILFHHRQPTGTPNMRELAHPFIVEHESLSHQYFVQHNGVIRNTDDLRDAHGKLGFEYGSELLKAFISKEGKEFVQGVVWNDSESLAIETALVLDGKKSKINTRGPAAVIGLQTKGKKVISRFFYRNNANPLKIEESREMLSITSSGKGDTVPILWVYRIKESGGYEIFPGNIDPPIVFETTVTQTYHHETHHGKTERRNNYYDPGSKSFVDYDSETEYAGFLKSIGTSLGLSSGKRVDDDVDYTPPEDIDYDAANLHWENRALLADLSVNELWAEHDLSIAREKDYKAKIEKLEIASRTLITLEELTEKEDLEQKNVQEEKWLDAILDEINTRNAQEEDSAPSASDVQERLSK